VAPTVVSPKIFGLVLLCLILRDFEPRRGRRLDFRLTCDCSIFGAWAKDVFLCSVSYYCTSGLRKIYIHLLCHLSFHVFVLLI
jgi:hypothetical protein